MKAEYIITIDGEPDIMGGYSIKKKQELIRCKDCKYWQDNNEYDGPNYDECRWGHDETPDPDDFCSFGRRMDK